MNRQPFSPFSVLAALSPMRGGGANGVGAQLIPILPEGTVRRWYGSFGLPIPGTDGPPPPIDLEYGNAENLIQAWKMLEHQCAHALTLDPGARARIAVMLSSTGQRLRKCSRYIGSLDIDHEIDLDFDSGVREDLMDFVGTLVSVHLGVSDLAGVLMGVMEDRRERIHDLEETMQALLREMISACVTNPQHLVNPR